MLLTSAALLGLAATTVSASPAEAIAKRNAGAPIPIHKRSSLSKDGVFDREKANALTVVTHNKHRQNLLNIEKNLGIDKLHVGAVIKDIARLPESIAAILSKRQNEALQSEEEDTLWAGNLTVGSDNQPFYINFDTGSADFWIVNKDCQDSVCTSKDQFNTNSSSTLEPQDGWFEIQYGDGSKVSGPVYKDTVTVAGITANEQSFSAATTVSSQFSSDPTDGLMGLAYPSLSNLNQNPFFVSAHEQGAVKANAFAFKLADTGSELYLGGTNPELYDGDIEYHAVDTETGFWQIGDGSIKVDGQEAAGDFDAIIDSGTTIMYGPEDQVKAFYDKIPGSKVFDKAMGLYQFPCDSLPTIAFSFDNGKDWEVSLDNFNFGKTESGSNDCVGALSGMDLGLGDKVWLLGDSFMKNVYTAFDFDQNSVGFAALKEDGSEAPVPTSSTSSSSASASEVASPSSSSAQTSPSASGSAAARD